MSRPEVGALQQNDVCSQSMTRLITQLSIATFPGAVMQCRGTSAHQEACIKPDHSMHWTACTQSWTTVSHCHAAGLACYRSPKHFNQLRHAATNGVHSSGVLLPPVNIQMATKMTACRKEAPLPLRQPS